MTSNFIRSYPVHCSLDQNNTPVGSLYYLTLHFIQIDCPIPKDGAKQFHSYPTAMSAESFAVLRKNAGEDISKLAEEHFKHDLRDSDRDTLTSAGKKMGRHATVGSIIGLGLGVFLAFRLRRNRTQMFNAFRAAEKPTHVRFADGREGTQNWLSDIHLTSLAYQYISLISRQLKLGEFSCDHKLTVESHV